MASRSFLSSMLLVGNSNEEDHVNQEMKIQQDICAIPEDQTQIVPLKKRRHQYEVQHPDVEVIALSPTTLMAKNKFVCEVCYKGFPRDQNLQLHKRGHNLPWKLKLKSKTDVVKRKIYLCPERSCINHNPSHALGDLTGIKKHYSRKHCEKKYKCRKCEKMYAVRSDLKAHSKTCGTKEYKCHCGTIFSRRDSFINHRAFCDALAEGIIPNIRPMGVKTLKKSKSHNHTKKMNINSPHLGSHDACAQNLIGKNLEIAPRVSAFGRKSYSNFMIKTSTDKQTQQKDEGNSDTQFFTNLVNNEATLHKNMQLYNMSFKGNPINPVSDEGSSLFSGGSIVSHHTTSLYLSSHTGSIPQLSATGLLQKSVLLGSTSSTNTVANFTREYASSSSGGVDGHVGNSGSNGYHSNINEIINCFRSSGVGSSVFNQYAGGLNSSGVGASFSTVEQQPPQNSSFNIGFEQLSGVKMTRDFLGVGVEILENMSSDGPKSTTIARSFL